MMLDPIPSWIETAKKLLRPPNEPDDRLPSEHLIGLYALRGYRGPEVLVSSQPYPGAKRLDGFMAEHIKALPDGRFPEAWVERDAQALEHLAALHDAVRVVPAY